MRRFFAERDTAQRALDAEKVISESYKSIAESLEEQLDAALYRAASAEEACAEMREYIDAPCVVVTDAEITARQKHRKRLLGMLHVQRLLDVRSAREKAEAECAAICSSWPERIRP